MIRKLKLSDYDEAKNLVLEIHQLHYCNRPDIYNLDNPLPLTYFKNIINNKDVLSIVYEENKKILGLLIATKQNSNSLPIIKKRTTYFIEDIVVSHSHRHQGIGHKLYDYLLKQAQKEKCIAIELNVWSFNDDALKFYESLGMSIKNMKLEKILTSSDIEIEKTNLTITKKVNK